MLQNRNNGRARRFQTVFLVTAVIALLLAVLLIILTAKEREEQAEPRETAEQNTRDAEAFYMEDGFLRYADGAHLVGVDVSVHQGLIDWQAVGESGVEFAILRAGYRGSTQGLLYEDEQFRYNLEGAKAAGIRVGVYFFSQARNAEEAAEEAEFVCRLLNGETLDLPVFFDWETVDDGTHAPAPGEVEMTACALAFCREVERGGYDAGVYFNQSFGYRYLDLAELQDYALWLAEYGDAPTFRYRFDCLQYTADGSVPGIESEVDLDLLFLEE